MNDNQRISILPFPQFFNGNELSINIVVLPRNQNPLAPSIEQHGTIPDSVPFADAQLSFTANIFDTLNVFPHSFPPVSGIPLTTSSPANARPIFEAMGSHLQIANPNVLNTNGNVNNPLNDKPETAQTVSRTVKKYLPRSYRGAFNFTSPKHPNALTDDSYYCAVKAAEKVPGFQRSPDVISWGKAIAYVMRQPHLAEQAGMIYRTTMTLDPNHFENGGWLYIDLDVESDFRQQSDADHNFVKRYAVRIPALTAGEERQLFAPVLFPVLHKAQLADPDPAPNGNYDDIFREAAEYDDGFAKIVHCQQPPNRDLLLEDNDGAHPVKDVGIRLGWDDEQILIWYVRQMLADPTGDLDGRIDSPLGVFGYCIDVRTTDLPGGNWVSLNQVSSNQALTLSRTQNDFTNPIQLGDFVGELPYQVYPIQLDGRKDESYWLPMYFGSWNGHSMVLPDEEAALIYQTTNVDVNADPEDAINDTGTGVSGPARNQLNQIYGADLQNIVLRYGANYEFRIRLQDLSGGAPALDRNPVNQTNSDITSCRFKRYITPNQPRILEIMPGGNSDVIANSDEPQPISQLNIQRPKLGYPAVVYTGKYNDPIQRLIDQARMGITVDENNHSLNAEHRVGLGIADPDVGRVEITVEIASLKLDKLDSISGKDDYVHFYTTTRAFPTVTSDADYELSLNIPIQYIDATVVHTGDETDVENDLGLAGDIDTLSDIFLPTGRTARLTIRAICDDGDDPENYFGFISPGNKVYDNRFGEPIQIMAYSPSIDERNLVIQTAGVPMVQGIFMQSDLNTSFDGKISTLLFGKTSINKVSNVQQLADRLNIESNSLTLNAPKGERVVFGCSSRIRHTLAPDNSSLTLASKGDLINHWLVCISIELDRDWMWDALQTRSLLVRRTKKYTHSETAESTNALVGDIELIRTASFESLHNPDRQFTRLIFIDAVEPNRDELDEDGNPLFPDEIDLSYSLEFQFKPGHGEQFDNIEPLELRLPITTPPSQVPKIASVGIAQSPYVHNEKYSASEARNRYLWVEFEEEIEDADKDIYFARVLANAPDQLLSNNNPSLLAAPQEPALPLDPEPIRVITEGATNDLAGLNAMQPMEQSTSSKRHFILPLPSGLHADSDEMFGFFTYEFRVGHFRNQNTDEMSWTTAQGRFGRRLRVTGVQHPAPTLTCMPNRDEDKLWVTAPYAVAVHDGKNVTAKPPRTQLWALLYAQVKQADNQGYRNILLDDRQLDWRIQVKPKKKKTRVPIRDFVLEQYTDDQIQVLNAITTRNFKYEINAANVSNLLQLVDFTKKNKDATKYGTTVWSNNEINELLGLYCLPENSDLSVVVVEILPQITNVFDHVSEIEKPRNAYAAQTMVQTKSGEAVNNLAEQATFAKSQKAFARGPSPLDEQLGHHRILRVSPLSEVPEVCCTDC